MTSSNFFPSGSRNCTRTCHIPFIVKIARQARYTPVIIFPSGSSCGTVRTFPIPPCESPPGISIQRSTEGRQPKSNGSANGPRELPSSGSQKDTWNDVGVPASIGVSSGSTWAQRFSLANRRGHVGSVICGSAAADLSLGFLSRGEQPRNDASSNKVTSRTRRLFLVELEQFKLRKNSSYIWLT